MNYLKPDAQFLRQPEGSLFSDRYFDRVSKSWSTVDWPGALGNAVDYARGSFYRDFGYYLRRIERLGVSGDSALDAGCGCGHWSMALASRFKSVMGVDRTSNRIDAARWFACHIGLERVSFADADVTSMKFPAASFDFIFCYGVIISNVRLFPMLCEFNRLLKPGGSAYVVLNGSGWSKTLRDERGATNSSDRAQGIAGAYNSLCNSNLGDSAGQFSNVRLAMLRDPNPVHRVCEDQGGDVEQFEIALSELRKQAPANRETPALGMQLARTLDPSVETPRDAIAVLEGLAGRLGGKVPLIKVAAEIEKECGAWHLMRFLGDISSFIAGHNYVFSEPYAGRNYDAAEAEKAAELAGFRNFRDADEGMLRHPDYAGPDEPIYKARFDGERVMWEFMADKA